VCPCSVTSLAASGTEDRCRVILTYHIDRGAIDGTDVAGRSVALVADAPAKMVEGNWKVGVLVDSEASKEQVDKIVGVFSGQMGGPMAALAPLIGEVMGVEQRSFDYRSEGRSHQVTIGDGDVSVQVEDYVPEGLSEPTRLVGVSHPSNTTLTVARPVSGRIRAFGLDFETTDRSAFSAPFRWSA
jgi:hypothetical protein